MYDALASLCFNLFYDSADGSVQRSVNEETMQEYFSNFIREHIYYYDEETAGAEAYQWQERFKRDHLLLQAGKREYVFVHSTVMEFLAAYYLIEKYQEDNGQLPQLLRASLGRENLLELETVPIAAGYSLLAGYAILAILRDLAAEIPYPKERLHGQAVQCLAEVEWLLQKTFKALRIKSLKKPIQNIIDRNYQSVHWLYDYLKEQVLAEDKERFKRSLEGSGPQLRLSRPTLLHEYLDYEAFAKGDSELVDLREKWLRQLVQRDVVEQWLSLNQKAIPVERPGDVAVEEIALVKAENLLQLNSPGYHPSDKSFTYYQGIIGKELQGFFCSPNMIHPETVWSCSFSADGQWLVSASEDGILRLWEAKSGKEIRTFTGHKKAVNCCAFSPDGIHLISASKDQTLKLWETASGKCLKTITLPWISNYVSFSPTTPGLIVTANSNGTLTLFDFKAYM